MKFRKDEEAVSPVIGVILMVAITVILAAVIAAFVFGMGTPSAAPQASIVITGATASTQNITLTHSGGNSIDLSKTRAIIDGNSSAYHEVIPSLTTSTHFYSAGDNLVINTYNSTGLANVYLNNVNLNASATAVTGYFAFTPGTVTITLIDTVSTQQIVKITETIAS
jgi:flagellin-like protein